MERAWLGDDLIDLSRLTRDEIAHLNRRARYTCFTCKKDVVFKNGARKKAHFAHVGEEKRNWQPESAAHRLVKEALARWLREHHVPVEVERRFIDIDRIADVYFEFQGRRYVFEVQKSPMSDLEFKQRIDDYEQIGITVVWVFLGAVTQKKNCYRLPAVMQGRVLDKYLHFCTQRARMTLFEQPIFLSTRVVYCQAVNKRLADLSLGEVLRSTKGKVWLDASWLGVKEQFRRKGWVRGSKSEMKLVEQCLLRGFNLAMVPPIVGWPVPGGAMGKPLFVWQMYVVMILLKHFKVGDTVKIQEMVRLLVVEYEFFKGVEVAIQVKIYLRWLVKFGVLKQRGNQLEYFELPEIKKAMEGCLEGDRILYERIVNGSK